MGGILLRDYASRAVRAIVPVTYPQRQK